MALTKTIVEDKIEVVGQYRGVQVRIATVIKEDGKELSRSFQRKLLDPGTLKGGDGSDKDDFVDRDISAESAEVQGICNAVWTSDVKTAWKNRLVAAKST